MGWHSCVYCSEKYRSVSSWYFPMYCKEENFDTSDRSALILSGEKSSEYLRQGLFSTHSFSHFLYPFRMRALLVFARTLCRHSIKNLSIDTFHCGTRMNVILRSLSQYFFLSFSLILSLSLSHPFSLYIQKK